MGKKILVVSQHFWPESFRVNDLCDFFVERGCDVDVLCGIPNYPKGKFYDGYSVLKNRRQKHNGVNILRAIEIPRGDNSNIRIFLNYISFPFFSLLLIPKLIFKRYDKIFIFQTSPVIMGFAGILLGKFKKIETTTYVLDLWPENLYSVLAIKNRFAKSIVSNISIWHYRNSDKLIALSNKMRLELIRKTSQAKHIKVLPQACEKLYESDIIDKKLSNRFKDGFNIVFTGSITPAQSFETVINAAKILKDKGIRDINWIVVGDGMSKKWLIDEVEKYEMTDCFYFEGLKPVEDVPKYTTIADVLIGCLVKSNLLEATIPAKVMSYIAAGKPIVLAMDGEVQALINEVIGCGFAGPADDYVKLASNIESLYMMSAQKRKELGKRARDYHFKNFERNIILSKLYDFMFNITTDRIPR